MSQDELKLAALNAALRLLSYRPRSQKELEQRLARKFVPELVQYAISHLKSTGLLDDTAFARMWRESRERQRPKGKTALMSELRSKGVDKETARDALEGLDEEALALKAAQKLLPRLARLSRRDFQQKLAGYLQRRGFSFEVTTRVVRQSWAGLTEKA
jgi:regulatory protein